MILFNWFCALCKVRKILGFFRKKAIKMQLVYKGKTKDVYSLEDGNYLLKFKDDVTGENGVFDPGANTVGLSIDGAGNAGLKMTSHFFKLLNQQGVKTHYVDADIENTTMTVLPATVFGKGLEVICRFRAVGSFIKRYGAYVEPGTKLDTYVELTIKDDDRGDPLINKEALAQLGIMTPAEYDQVAQMTKNISIIIKDELAKLGLELYDIKLEFGRVNGQVYLIDEISGGNMRVYKDGNVLMPMELSALIV